MKGNKNNLYVCCLDMNYLVLNLQAKVESNKGLQPKLKLVEHIIVFFFFLKIVLTYDVSYSTIKEFTS